MFEQIKIIQNCKINFSKLQDKTFLITGATGMIGKVFVEMLDFLNEKFSLNIKMILISRSLSCADSSNKIYFSHDITSPILFDGKIDFVINLAANTHPLAYSKFPVETIMTNFLGTKNCLELCKEKHAQFLNISSVEIYGEGKNGSQFKESDVGYLDCNSSRAGYNESKRLCESLCQSFLKEFGVEFRTARLCRIFGPTLKKDDSKALSQFLFSAASGKNIVLKSKGEQFFSYLNVFDCSTALFTILLKGTCGEAYNVSSEDQNVKLKDLAKMIADFSNVQVEFQLPQEVEREGYSKAQNAILDCSKLKGLGWKCQFSIEEAIIDTINIMKN